MDPSEQFLRAWPVMRDLVEPVGPPVRDPDARIEAGARAVAKYHGAGLDWLPEDYGAFLRTATHDSFRGAPGAGWPAGFALFGLGLFPVQVYRVPVACWHDKHWVFLEPARGGIVTYYNIDEDDEPYQTWTTFMQWFTSACNRRLYG